jgi:hypothetical protein
MEEVDRKRLTGAGPHLTYRARKNRIEPRRVLVAEGLLAKLTTSQIRGFLADEGFEVSHGTVVNDIAAVHESWRERAARTYDDYVAEQLATLDALRAAVLPAAFGGELGAVDRVLAIEARRSKLLGLDRPTRVEAKVEVSAYSLRLDGDLAALIALSRDNTAIDVDSRPSDGDDAA